MTNCPTPAGPTQHQPARPAVLSCTGDIMRQPASPWAVWVQRRWSGARPVIEDFSVEMLGGPRPRDRPRDRRAKDELYLRGLLLDGRRKSTQPMAGFLGMDHRELRRFVVNSIWDHAEFRWRLAAGWSTPSSPKVKNDPSGGGRKPTLCRCETGRGTEGGGRGGEPHRLHRAEDVPIEEISRRPQVWSRTIFVVPSTPSDPHHVPGASWIASTA